MSLPSPHTSPGVPRGWRAGPVIWGKCIATPLQMAWPCFATPTGGGKTAGLEGGGLERRGPGSTRLGWESSQFESGGSRRKGCVSSLKGGSYSASLLPHLLLPSPPHHPPPPRPPVRPFPFSGESYPPTVAARCTRVLFVTVRQKGLSGSRPPRPAATVALPGSRATPWHPNHSQEPVPAVPPRLS